MSKVNVVDSNGKVVSVDESVVEADEKYGVDTGELSAAGEQEQRRLAQRSKNYGGVLAGAVAGALGAADAVSGGLVGAGFHAAGLGQGYEDIAQEHPTARTIGEIGAFAVPGLSELGVGGLAAKGARAAGVGVTGARIAEGAVYGMGGALASSNASGDPLTIEALVEGAGVGGLINYGAGALGDQFIAAGKSAKVEVDLSNKADTARELFDAPHPAYEELVTARDAARQEAQQANSLVKRQTAAMEAYKNSTEDFIRDRNGFNKALDQVFVGANSFRDTIPAGWSEGVDREAALDVLNRGKKAVDQATAMRNTDMEGAINKLRPLRDELAQKFDIVVPDLPAIPGKTVNVPDALPKDLEGFARMRATTAADGANTITPTEQAALQNLTKELGLMPSSTASGTFADVQAQLAGHASALDSIKEVGKPSNSLLVKTLKWITRKGVRVGAGAAAGSAIPIPGAAIVGGVVGGFAHTALATSAMEARSVVRKKIAGMVAKFGGPVGKGMTKLGPVTSYLTTSFPSGKSDKSSTDLGQLAKSRLNELAAATVTAPDTAYHAVQPIIGVPGNIGQGIHAHTNAALQHIIQNAPKDAGMSPRGTKSDWKPSPTEAISLAYRLEALQHPLDAMARALGGEVHPDGIDAVHANWPALSSALAEELMGQTDKIDKLSPERLNGYSALLGAPMSGLSVPASVIALQGLYMPGAAQARQPQGQEQPGEAGRPPKAGRSTVAGSNVNSLISQG